MSINVYLKSKSGYFDAMGVYEENNFVVKKGSKIRLTFAEHIRGGQKAISYRNDPKYVTKSGVVLVDCCFGSPSTAAQFVTGCSTNGYEAWHVDKKTSLGMHLGRGVKTKNTEEDNYVNPDS